MALDPVSAGIGLVDTFINKFVKDKDLAQKLKASANSEEFQGNIALQMGQIAINKIEAGSKSFFVAGWRPAVGWICATGVGIKFIILPVFSWAAVVLFDFPAEDLPQFSIAELMTLLTGMLGFGYLRSKDKEKGVAS